MSTPKLEQWEHHVIQAPRSDGGRGGTAYCGAEVWSHEWHFLDAAHAALTVAHGDRLQPCPACWEKLQAQGDAGAGDPPVVVQIPEGPLSYDDGSDGEVVTTAADLCGSTLTRNLFHDGDAEVLPDGRLRLLPDGAVVRPAGYRVLISGTLTIHNGAPRPGAR